MATKPTIDDARWATDETNNTAPAAGQRDSGWTTAQVAVSSYFNKLFFELYKWALYLSEGALTGAFSWASTISPAAITGTSNDYAPTGLADAQIIRQDLSAAATLTGLTAGTTGRHIVLVNIDGSFRLTLSHEGAGSTAANRFALPGGVSYYLDPGQSVVLSYDATSARWRVVNGTGTSAVSRTRVFAVDGFSVEAGTPANIGSMIVATGADIVDIPLSGLSVGERITAVRMRGNDAGGASFCRGELFRRSTGSASQVGADMDTSPAGTGSYNEAVTGLTEDIVTDRAYFFRWSAGASGDSIQIIEITTEPTP